MEIKTLLEFQKMNAELSYAHVHKTSHNHTHVQIGIY